MAMSEPEGANPEILFNTTFISSVFFFFSTVVMEYLMLLKERLIGFAFCGEKYGVSSHRRF